MDLHDRFDDWLADGADGDPPRDLALHASTCDGCLRAVAVVESLQAIQVGAAGVPPLRFGAGRPRPFRVARMAIGTLAVILLGVSIAIGASGILAPAPLADAPAESTAGRVLGGLPTDEATDEASPTPTPSASDSPPPSPSATPTASPEPTAAPVQPPAPRTPAPRTPAPQPPPPTLAPPTPAPTVAPTIAPTVAPTSAPPTPSPTPPTQCSNGLDDDGDNLIDFGQDPGCIAFDDDDETDLIPLP